MPGLRPLPPVRWCSRPSLPRRRRSPATFWGVVPQATPTEEQFQRLKRGGVDSIRIPIELERRRAAPGRRSRLGRHRRPGPRRRRRRHRGPPLHHRRPALGGPVGLGARLRPHRQGAQPPAGLAAPRPAPGPPSSARPWPATAPAAPSGRSTRPLPVRPVRTWQIWNEPNFKYFVAKPNPAEYGKLVKLSYGAAQGCRPGSQDRSSAASSRGRSKRPGTPSRRGPTSPPTSSNRCTRRRRGSRPSSTASPCTRTPAATGSWRPTSKNPALGPEEQRRRRQGPLDHRARLELQAPFADRVQHLRQGRRRPGPAAEGRLLPAPAQRGEMASQAPLLVLGRRPGRQPATSATAPASSPKASSRRRPGSNSSSSPAASPSSLQPAARRAGLTSTQLGGMLSFVMTTSVHSSDG